MRCEACGCQAATKYVSFHQNIGALVMRFRKEVAGELCRSCIHSYFWKFTLTTLAIGWLGMISLILAPLFIINNIFYYIRALATIKNTVEKPPQVASDHPTMSLTNEAFVKLKPYRMEIEIRRGVGESMDVICMNVAQRAGVSAMQVELFAAQKD